MTTANNDVFILLLGWIEFWWEGIKIRWRGTEWTNFWLVGGLPHPVSRKILYKICQKVFIYNEEALRISHTSCAKVTVLLLQDFSTLCVTDIYGIYFHLPVQCFWYNKFITSWTCLIRPNDERSISQKSISH